VNLGFELITTAAPYDGKNMCSGTGQYPTTSGGFTPAGSPGNTTAARELPVGLYENPEGDQKHDDAEFEEFMRSLRGHGVEDARIDAMRETRYGPRTAANQQKNQTVMEIDRPGTIPMRPRSGEVRRPSTDQRKVRRQLARTADFHPEWPVEDAYYNDDDDDISDEDFSKGVRPTGWDAGTEEAYWRGRERNGARHTAEVDDFTLRHLNEFANAVAFDDERDGFIDYALSSIVDDPGIEDYGWRPLLDSYRKAHPFQGSRHTAGSYDPIGYTYDADVHCPGCAIKRFGKEPGRPWVREDAVDSEGNPVHPIAPWDETAEGGEYCGTCHGQIASPHDGYLERQLAEDQEYEREMRQPHRPGPGQGRMFGSLSRVASAADRVISEHDDALWSEAGGVNKAFTELMNGLGTIEEEEEKKKKKHQHKHSGISLYPDDWTDADWDTMDLESTDEPPCPKCGAQDSFVTATPGKYDPEGKLRCVECGVIINGRGKIIGAKTAVSVRPNS
jgi:hypothetical protein